MTYKTVVQHVTDANYLSKIKHQMREFFTIYTHDSSVTSQIFYHQTKQPMSHHITTNLVLVLLSLWARTFSSPSFNRRP